MHDIGKARVKWQLWIRNLETSKKSKSVNHSPLGAAVFVMSAHRLLKKWELEDALLKRQLLLLARDIYDHHGKLGDIDESPPWQNTLVKEDLLECDLAGIANYINGFFNELQFGQADFLSWLEDAPDVWRNLYLNSKRVSKRLLRNHASTYLAAANVCFNDRGSTSKLILADRYHAAGIDSYKVEEIHVEDSLKQFKNYCQTRATMAKAANASDDIIKLRQEIQNICQSNYNLHKHNAFFTLLLPTGLGKTLTSTKIALQALKEGKCKKIIYVAPYLSILSQATKEISESTGLEVFQHNHLAVFENEQELTEQDLLVMDSWEAPIITTTFNQLFRGLFPARAQHSLRIAGLEQAFVIIDEPQIIDLFVWNIFLHMLQAAVEMHNMQVLFSSATMPNFEFGLNAPICALAPLITSPDRYKVNFLPNVLNEEGVVDLALSYLSNKDSIAIIMNTIKDAGEVYRLLKDRLLDVNCFNLTGCMTPPHKAKRINEIKDSLEKNDKTIVVSTQVIECGVDLSFDMILRALPVLPSIAQAAGRANRHGERGKAEIIVFEFQRQDKIKTRPYVYKAEEARRVTDDFLRTYSSWNEPQTTDIIHQYYHELSKINTRTSSLELLTDAINGEWTAIAGFEPFFDNFPKVCIFVPNGEKDLSERARELLIQFTGTGDPERLYELYLDKKFRSQLDYVEKKKFMGLLQQFCVSVDPKTARTIVAGIEDVAIARLADYEVYSSETGLAHIVAEGEETGIFYG